jgi:tetratricopeptide (TPR) repeat protein
VDTSENPQPEAGPSDDGGAVRRLLDQAARAYMDGNYPVAIESWQEVLDSDPANPRAREGIKKVSMLQADDTGDAHLPFDPVIEEIEGLLKRRSFDEALQACHQQMEGAGPALKNALRTLQQKAERARVVEPEIQRCMVDARRSLQAGKVAEALPHLKQVLTLDRSHPVASRLMEGLRQRVRRRDTPVSKAAAPAQPQAAQEQLMDEIDQAAELLPASGQPGSDAPEENLSTPDNVPAPLGQGLPSSPIGEGPDPSAPEIDLDMISLDDGLGADGDDVVASAPMEIQLEGESGPVEDAVGEDLSMDADDIGRRSAASGHTPESPFEGFEGSSPAVPHGTPEENEPEAVDDLPAIELTGKAAAADPMAGIAGESLADVLGTDDEDREMTPIVPRQSGTGRTGSPVVRYGVLAGVVLAGGLAAAWQFGLLGASHADFGVNESAVESAAVPAPGDGEQAAVAPAGGEKMAGPDQATEPGAATSGTSDPRRALVLLEKGQDHFKAGRIPEAKAALAQALKLDPMNAEIAALMGRAEQETQALSREKVQHNAAVAAFKSKEFELALRKFYRLEETEPSGPYGGYIINSWYNWGLQFLAAGNLREAGNKMDEVLSIKADDADALAIKKLVSDYANRAKDRSFFAQIEALRYRPLDS